MGYAAPPTLRNAERDMVVRAGIIPHFDLWIRAESTAGRAISRGFFDDVKPLTPEEGKQETIRLLKLERDSRKETPMEELLKLELEFQREV